MKTDQDVQELDEQGVEVNNNQHIIDALPQLLMWLTLHPNAPKFKDAIKLERWVYNIDDLKLAVRGLGSAKKKFDGRYIEVRATGLPEATQVTISAPRGHICEEVVTYKCSDELVSFLRPFEGEDEFAESES
jgi:hypothetical protein